MLDFLQALNLVLLQTEIAETVVQLDWMALLLGLILIVLAIFVIVSLKNIIVNSILGVIAWAIIYYVIGWQIGFWPSLIVSAIFGLAGLGVILVLNFLGFPI